MSPKPLNPKLLNPKPYTQRGGLPIDVDHEVDQIALAADAGTGGDQPRVHLQVGFKGSGVGFWGLGV